MPLMALAFLLVYILGLAAAVLYPLVGVLLYLIVYHLHPESQWWGPHVSMLGSRLSFTVAAATLIGLILRWPRPHAAMRQFQLPYLLAVLLLATAVASLGWGLAVTPRGLYQAEKFSKILVFLFMLVRCVTTPGAYHAVVLAWLLGVMYLGYQATGGGGVTITGRLNDGIGGPDFGESSDLAVHLVASLPLIGAVFFMCKTWWGRGLTLIVGALAVNTLIMTRTRNALAGLAVIALTCALSLPRNYRLRGVTGIVIGTLLAAQLADPGWWSRMSTALHYEHDEAAIGRITYWKAAMRMAADYPLGIGLGNFHHVIMDYVPNLNQERGAHSTVFACLAELGWFGLAVFGAIVLATLHSLRRVTQAARRLPEFAPVGFMGVTSRFHLAWHSTALRSALLGYLASAMFTTRLFSEDFWLLVGLALCLRNAAAGMQLEHEAAAPAPPPAPEPRFADHIPASKRPYAAGAFTCAAGGRVAPLGAGGIGPA